MNITWFKNPDNIIYAPVDEFAGNFGKETGIDHLREKIEDFKNNPVAEGVTLKGIKRTSLRLIIPNMIFKEKIDMGDTVWVYMGEMYEAYCLYWPSKEQEQAN